MIVVPPGALSQTLSLQIAEIGASTASLPAGVQPASAVYALTPHGTTFALPVTVTVPFDPAQLAAGQTLYALKTTDAGLSVWDIAGAATVSGTSASVELTSFSNSLMAGIGLPTIAAQPGSATASVGQSATFSVVASANGAPWLTYQWRRDGTPIAGATGASYAHNVLDGDNGARFTVVVGNGLGEVISAEAVLTVSSPAPGGLDLTGRWRNDYRCTTDTGSEFSDSETISVVQTGTDVSLSSGDFAGTGTLSGDEMEYSGSGPGYTEEGTWTRDGSDDRFAKQSSYTNSPSIGGAGTCTGTLRRLADSVAIAVAGGGTFALAIKDDGTLWAWGWNRNGELGLGLETINQMILVPTRVGTARDWSAISASVEFALGLRGGQLWAWGSGTALGDGAGISRFSPVRVGTANTWRAVAAGGGHAAGLRSDGTLWAWGLNGQGQLGDGTAEQRLVPTQIGTDTDWAAIAAGMSHTVALKTDGSLWAWGDNADGQVGDGSTTQRRVPTRIGAASDWTQIAAGNRYTLAVRADGSLWAWGYNETGQLGDGTLTRRLAPTRVGAANDWASVAAGWWQTSMAIKTDGSLWGWGEGYSGELGNGSSGIGARSSVPIRIGATTSWSTVAVGRWHVHGIQAGGSLWGWGYNLNGQLGDGTRDEKLVPVKVPF